jgi:Fe-S oxidoreductase
MSFLEEQKDKAILVAEKCIECGRCFQNCQFDLFPKDHMECFKLIRESNNAILNQKKISGKLKDFLFKCSICNKCQLECPENLKRADANLYLKLITMDPIRQSFNISNLVPSFKKSITTNVKVSAQNKEEKKWLKVLNTIELSNILVYHGCYLNYSKESCMKLENILVLAKENFTSIGGKEYCCGGIEGYRGKKNVFRKSYHKLKKAIRDIQPFEILTTCGHCYDVISKIVNEMNSGIKVKHVADKILELVKSEKIKLHKIKTSVSIQDSCLFSEQNYKDSPVRQLLKRIVKVNEIDYPNKISYCCGEIPMAYDKKVTDTQVEKIKKSYKKTKSHHLCTYCSRCYEVFSYHENDFRPIEFIDLIYDSCFNRKKLNEEEFVPMPEKEDSDVLSISNINDDKKLSDDSKELNTQRSSQDVITKTEKSNISQSKIDESGSSMISEVSLEISQNMKKEMQRKEQQFDKYPNTGQNNGHIDTKDVSQKIEINSKQNNIKKSKNKTRKNKSK